MAAFAFEAIDHSRYYVRLDSAVAEREIDYSLVLDAARDLTGSQTAIVYNVAPEETEVQAVAIRSSLSPKLKNTGVTFGIGASRWLDALSSAAQGAPRGDVNFEKFPEAIQYQIKRLIVVPLRGDSLLGLLTVGRTVDTIFSEAEIENANRAGRILAAVLERDSLQHKLAERKLIERAKGILQQKRRLSEEQAYLMLRTNSRRRRVPMATVAREIIETHLASYRLGAPRQQLQTA